MPGLSVFFSLSKPQKRHRSAPHSRGKPPGKTDIPESQRKRLLQLSNQSLQMALWTFVAISAATVMPSESLVQVMLVASSWSCLSIWVDRKLRSGEVKKYYRNNYLLI